MDRAERTKQMGILNDVDYEKAQDEVKLAEMRFASAKQEAGLAGETLAFEVTNRESQVEQQRLVVAELERQVDALAVKAPFDGLVSRVAVADRDSVTEGQPLVGVVDLSRLEIEVWVPESYAPDIKPGTPAVITIDARQLQGEVTSLSPEVQGSRVRGVVGFSGATPAGLKQSQRVSASWCLRRGRRLKVARGAVPRSARRARRLRRRRRHRRAAADRGGQPQRQRGGDRERPAGGRPDPALRPGAVPGCEESLRCSDDRLRTRGAVER